MGGMEMDETAGLRDGEWLMDIHAFIDGLYAHDLHAKRVNSPAAATRGVMNGPPCADAPLQGAASPGGQFRMAPLHLSENRAGTQVRRGRQHRHHLGVEEVGERIGATTAAHRLVG